MRWISSAGGPLLVIQTSLVPEWLGVVGGDDSGSHYDIACTVGDYTGVIPWRGRAILVLNDEPFQTAIHEDDDGPMLVRWMYAPEEAVVIASLKTIRRRLGVPAEIVEYDIHEETSLIMDAAADGRYIREALQLQLIPGKYQVLTYLHKPTDDLGLLIHTFVRQ